MAIQSYKMATRAASMAGVALLLAVQSAAATSPAAPAFAPPSVKATTSNPFAGCTIGSGGSGTVVYPSAEVEPMVAVNPANRQNIIGVVQQDRWNDGGARGLVAMVSHNGGASFHVVPLPFSSCAPGGLPYERASDPWVSIGPDGTAYAVSISFDENSTRGNVAVATSTDGGDTWGTVREVITDTDFFNDKEAVTADPVIPGTAYVVWDRAPYCCSFPGPSFISKTTDFGLTWSTPQQMTPTNDNRGEIGNLIVVDPRNGTLYDVFNRFYDSSRVSRYMVIKSTDGGATWSKPVAISPDRSVVPFDPHPNGPELRTSYTLPEVAIDPASGRLYVVWEDARFTGGTVNQALMSTSANGSYWSKPSVVSTVTGQLAFNPQIAVNDLGQVAVTYYDFRDYDRHHSNLPTSVWMRVSPAGGKDFGPDIALLQNNFNMLTAPEASGLFLGDYEGLAARGSKFVALYCKTTGSPNHTTDCYATQVRADSNGYPMAEPLEVVAPALRTSEPADGR